MISPIVPLNQFIGDGNTLFKWMGSFWTTLYQDPDFLKRLQAGRAIAAAQAYLDVLEAAQLVNRKELPVLHRERWYPLVIRKSQRGTGVGLKLGMEPTPVLGPQTDPAYPSGSMFELGGNVPFADLTSYPLAVVPKYVATCIVDNLVSPNVIMARDSDFVIEDGTLIIRKSKDPFEPGSVFPIMDIDSDSGEADQETVLWACDTYFDKDYVYNYLGYVLGAHTTSTEYYKTLLNAIWDLITSGAMPELFSAVLGALCGIPVVLSATETVETITTDPDGDQLVITDKQIYRLPANAVLRESVVPGAVLRYGTFLDRAVKIYPALIDPRSSKIRGSTEYAADLRTDIPAVTLPPTFFKTPLEYGFCLSWDSVPIYCAGIDTNGNPKLWFPVQGLAADVTAFWTDVWLRCEQANISLETCFIGYLDGIVPYQDFQTGAIYGYVEPLTYFLRNLIGANTLLVTLDVTQLRTGDRQNITPVLVDLLRETLPVYIRLFLVERRTADVEDYDLSTKTSSDSVDQYLGLSVESMAHVGGPSTAHLTFKDRPIRTRWIAKCEE